MRLSELKELNPKAYEVFLEEIGIIESPKSKEIYVLNNIDFSCCIFWMDTRQGNDVWNYIYFDKDFTLFNEWLSSTNG